MAPVTISCPDNCPLCGGTQPQAWCDQALFNNGVLQTNWSVVRLS